MPQKVAFVGLGYIGLPTAVVMANSGLQVIGVDVLPEKVDAINQGRVTIVEPGLESELQAALESGRFTASTTMPEADAYVIAVPTPFKEDYKVDMSYISAAAEKIAPMLKGNELVVLESTSPPQTTEIMARQIAAARPDLVVDGMSNISEQNTNLPKIFVAHCPERILPGRAVEELRTNDRIIGGITPEATERAADLYSAFCEGQLLKTDAKTAEMAKLTENSFRDVNIAFANELSNICDEFDINVWELIDLANHHPRVDILQPGPGVGGHCIAVDPWFIVSSAPSLANLIHTARKVNDAQPSKVIAKVESALASNTSAPVALLGLAFKKDIDDLRESPALRIAENLAERNPNTTFWVVEPNIEQLPTSLADFENVEFKSLKEIESSTGVVVLLVDHKQFVDPGLTLQNQQIVIDTRGAMSNYGAPQYGHKN